MPVTSRITAFSALLLVALPATANAGAEPSFVPVFKHNFPDPFVVVAGNQFIAYATNDGINVPMLVSRDLISWSPVADPANPAKRLDAMPSLAHGCRKAHLAPEVMKVGAKWLLYYTAHRGPAKCSAWAWRLPTSLRSIPRQLHRTAGLPI